MEFVDFTRRVRSKDIELLFPRWQRGERVAFLSPHDDDVILGAGYILDAAVNSGGECHVYVFCKGDAGYSSAEEKESVVERRRTETIDCYSSIGVVPESIYFADIPDFSLMSYLNRKLPNGAGLFDYLVREFRENRISRVVFSNGHFEHWDHTAVFLMGMYTVAQAGDPILADLGAPSIVQSFLVYSVWGDFDPQPAFAGGIRVDKGILADPQTEQRVRRAIEAFSSQRSIIQGIIAHREQRRSPHGYLELYRTAEVRTQIYYRPYINALNTLKAI